METPPPYAARLEIDRPDTMQRLSTFFRILWVIPIWIILSLVMGGGSPEWSSPGFSSEKTWNWEWEENSTAASEEEGGGVSAGQASNVGENAETSSSSESTVSTRYWPPTGLFLATVLMLLFRKRYPRWWFDFLLEFTRFSTRISAYLLLLTDRYPSTVDMQSVHLNIDYPDAERDLHRALPLVKWLLALPHYLILLALGLAVLVCTVIAWFSILFTGRYPEALFDFVVGVLRWGLRVQAYAWLLVTDAYPPFSTR